MNDALSDFWYLLNTNISVSPEDIMVQQKSLLLHTFLKFAFCSKTMKAI